MKQPEREPATPREQLAEGGELKPRRGERKSKAHFLVERVNLGDGDPVRCWVRVTAKGIEVRRYRAKRGWYVPLADAAGVLARRAQVLACGAGEASA